jgi:hypothetical protein
MGSTLLSITYAGNEHFSTSCTLDGAWKCCFAMLLLLLGCLRKPAAMPEHSADRTHVFVCQDVV